jgi:hypothetical protein
LRTTKRASLALAAAGAFVVLTAAAALGQQATPTLTASATDGLTNGQVVTLNVSGFFPSDPASLTIVECARTAVDIGGCDVGLTQDILVTNGDGTGSGPYTIKEVPGLCDASTPCAIFALENPQAFDNTTVGSRFAKVSITLTGGTTTTTGGGGTTTTTGQTTTTTGQTTTTTAGGGTTTTTIPPVVPEVGSTILLPLGAASVIGLGTLLTLRRRRGGADVD